MVREFKTFGGLGRHLIGLAAQGEAVTNHITQASAEALRDAAQVRIGMYQEQTGPYAAWAPLADSTIADRIRQGYTPFDPLLRTGSMRDSIVVEQQGNEAVVGSKSLIALWQEVGTEHIPPRSFLGAAGFASRPVVAAIATLATVAWISGGSWKRPRQSIKLP